MLSVHAYLAGLKGSPGKAMPPRLQLAICLNPGVRMQADAVLHFGTHGSLEFMPGKQVGMSGVCYPDSLIGEIPNLYYYAANNPSEATIAKRRSYANTISYLTPPAENAGLYKGLKVRDSDLFTHMPRLRIKGHKNLVS